MLWHILSYVCRCANLCIQRYVDMCNVCTYIYMLVLLEAKAGVPEPVLQLAKLGQA